MKQHLFYNSGVLYEYLTKLENLCKIFNKAVVGYYDICDNLALSIITKNIVTHYDFSDIYLIHRNKKTYVRARIPQFTEGDMIYIST